MAVMVGIGDDLKKLAITPRTADVLWRTSPCGRDQAGISDTRERIRDTLDLDGVLPTVAEVIEVPDRFHAEVFEQIEERGFARIQRAVRPIWTGNTPTDTPGLGTRRDGCWTSRGRPVVPNAGDQAGWTAAPQSGASPRAGRRAG